MSKVRATALRGGEGVVGFVDQASFRCDPRLDSSSPPQREHPAWTWSSCLNSRNSMKTLLGSEVIDIILTGVVDLDETPHEFVAILDTIYIKTSVGIASIEVDEDALLNVCFPSRIATSSDRSVGVGCYSSIGKYMLTHPDAINSISHMGAYNRRNNGDHITCSAFEIKLNTGQLFFFDPLFFSGTSFGGKEQRELWMDNTDNYSYARIV